MVCYTVNASHITNIGLCSIHVVGIVRIQS